MGGTGVRNGCSFRSLGKIAIGTGREGGRRVVKSLSLRLRFFFSGVLERQRFRLLSLVYCNLHEANEAKVLFSLES